MVCEESLGKNCLGLRTEMVGNILNVNSARKKLIFHKNIKVLANEDTLLPTQMFPHLPTHTNFVSGTQKCF